MGTQAEYSFVANKLVAEIHRAVGTLSPWQQSMILEYLTPEKTAAIAGDGAKIAVDALDQYRTVHPPQPIPAPASTTAKDVFADLWNPTHKPRKTRK